MVAEYFHIVLMIPDKLTALEVEGWPASSGPGSAGGK
jgi:hypothetical protein